MKAIWNDQIIAESDDTVVVEGNHYFPIESINQEVLEPSDTTTVCPWKGLANYYSLHIEGLHNVDAAWYYDTPLEAARELKGRVAFWKGVKIV